MILSTQQQLMTLSSNITKTKVSFFPQNVFCKTHHIQKYLFVDVHMKTIEIPQDAHFLQTLTIQTFTPLFQKNCGSLLVSDTKQSS